jgi:hypothetical protein
MKFHIFFYIEKMCIKSIVWETCIKLEKLDCWQRYILINMLKNCLKLIIQSVSIVGHIGLRETELGIKIILINFKEDILMKCPKKKLCPKQDGDWTMAPLFKDQEWCHKCDKIGKDVTPKKGKFKDRYVIGEGYPWGYGVKKIMMMGLNYKKIGMNTKQLKFPKALWDTNIPKYRIVLERVK